MKIAFYWESIFWICRGGVRGEDIECTGICPKYSVVARQCRLYFGAEKTCICSSCRFCQSSNTRFDMRRIGITGGIGSGKSVVSRLLRIMGYSVYDTDSEAKRLMESSLEVVQKLSECFGRDIYHNGRLNRGLLSSRVFGESDKIVLLNSIVHPVVRFDFYRWSESLNEEICFVESAILYESRFDELVDEVWTVTAPEELRIGRVRQRSGLTEEEIKKRMAAQLSEEEKQRRAAHIIWNDGNVSVIHRVLSLLKSLE